MLRNKSLVFWSFLFCANINAAHQSAHQMLGQAKDYVAIGKKIFEQIEQIVNSSKIVDGKLVLSGLKTDIDIDLEDIAPLIKYFEENGLVARVTHGALKPEQTALAKATRIYTNIPAEKLTFWQGIALGILGTKLVTIVSNAAMPSTICSVLPVGGTALITAGCLGAGVYMLYNYMPIPKTLSEKIMYTTTHLATHIAPHIGIGLAGSIKAAQEEVNNKLKQRIFTHLRATLNITQKKLLSQKYILLVAYFKPELLRQEKLFLNALNQEQVDITACLFKSCAPEYASVEFDSFASTLTDAQINRLKPSNKLLIAQFNPAILQAAPNEQFLQSLDDKQAQMLLDAIKQCEK